MNNDLPTGLVEARSHHGGPSRRRLLGGLVVGALAAAGVELASAKKGGNGKGRAKGKGRGNGKGKGQEKVAICHNGQTITVARPAVAAHLAHGDTEGACAPADS